MTKKQIYSLIIFIILLFALPLAIFLAQKRQDIRPRALQGKANILMSSDKNSSSVGGSIDVLVSLQHTESGLKVSGIDFMILYDKEKLDVVNILPALESVMPAGVFSEAPVVTSGGIFDDTFNFIRVVELAKMPSEFLPSGAISLAIVTFRSIGEGSAVVKLPEDNLPAGEAGKYIEIVGIEGNLSVSPEPTKQEPPPPTQPSQSPQPTSPPPQPTSPPPQPTSPPCTGNCCNEGCHGDESSRCIAGGGICTGLGSCPEDRPNEVAGVFWCGCEGNRCGSGVRDGGRCCKVAP